MPRTSFYLFLFSVLTNLATAQVEIKTEPLSKEDFTDLRSVFTQYQVFELNTKEVYHQLINNSQNEIEWTIGEQNFWFTVKEQKITADNYLVRIKTANGISEVEGASKNVFVGKNLKHKKSNVVLAINNNLIYGSIGTNQGYFFVEPLIHFDKNAKANLFVIYNEHDILDDKTYTCGFTQMNDDLDQLSNLGSSRSAPDCVELEMAIASDFSMFERYGSVQNVINHNLLVITGMQVDYFGNFDNDIEVVIVEQFLSVCNGCDPWSSTTDAGGLVNNFGNWARNGGFLNEYDNGQMWTTRDISGGVVGVAQSLNGICSNTRHHLIEDYTTNQNSLRQVATHELGHNWGCQHVGNGFIMAPTVNGSSLWSNQSINTINARVASLSGGDCFDNCNLEGTPIALFQASKRRVCSGSVVNFYNESIDNDGQFFQWSFPGGSPDFSTEENPSIQYDDPGEYEVSLTVSNGLETNTTVETVTIEVSEEGRRIVLFEDFERGLGEWDINNNDGGNSWTIQSTDGVSFGSNSMVMQNFGYNAIGQKDELQSPLFSLSCDLDYRLSIDYAYRRINNNRKDSLLIKVSLDGGNSFPDIIYANTESGDLTFATNTDFNSNFIPSNTADWCFGNATPANCLDIDFSAYSGLDNLVLMIQNVNGNGNNLIIDNIELSAACLDFDEPIAAFEGDVNQGCAPLTVSYTNNSEGNPCAYFWEFPGGNPSVSNERNPVVFYDNPGVYDVRLEVSNNIGTDLVEIENYIELVNEPDPFFDYEIIGPLEIQFLNESLFGETYLWNFGDGNTSSEVEPIHVYSSFGEYDVTLTVTNICGEEMIEFPVFALSIPEAEFMANVTTGCTPLTVQFTDLSTGEIDNRDWSFPGGDPSVSSETNPLVVYETAGTYDVTLVVSNSVGMDEQVKIGYITVIDRPIANFTFLPDMLTVNFQSTSLHADSLSWSFGDGALSIEPNPSHTYASEGMYTVTLIAINGCASDTFALDLNLQNSPSGGFGSDRQMGCSPLEIQFFDQSTGNVDAWEWTFEGAVPATSDLENPIVVYDLPGSYDVNLITTNSSGSDTTFIEDYITVLENPIADFSFEVFSDSVSFTNLSQFADSYIWIFDDGDSSMLENPSHVFEEPGIYNVELIAINECGENSRLFKVTPAIPPTADFSIVGGNGNGCVPFVVDFSDISSGAISTWAWTFEGGDPLISNSPNPTVTYNNAGVFKVELIVTNQFGVDTIELDSLITVTNQPRADFTFSVDSNTVAFQNTSSDGVVHFWNYGDGSQATEFENSHTYDTAGTYNVQLVAVNTCGLDTIFQEVTISPITSTNNILSFEELSLFPNPNDGQFLLEMKGLQSNDLELSLVNVLGQQVLQRKLDVSNGEIAERFSLISKNAGVYLLIISNGDKMITKRVIVY